MAVMYPRPLRLKERDLLEAVLPPDRPGYRRYRELLEQMTVLGEGRRGTGNIVLGYPPDIPDASVPLAPVVAYGVVETVHDQFTVTVRECTGDQIDVEIVSAHGEEIPDHFEEKHRWTYSTWLPGMPSPATQQSVREVTIDTSRTFVISPAERRLWLYDGTTGMNHPIPITNYYNELMLHRKVRDPHIALRSSFLFENLSTFPDEDLRGAFMAYNNLRRRVELYSPTPDRSRTGMVAWVQSLLGAKK